MSEGVFAPLRKIKLYFPAIELPQMSYRKAMMNRVHPLKERFSVFSQRK